MIRDSSPQSAIVLAKDRVRVKGKGNFKDVTGQRFGRLIVLGLYGFFVKPKSTESLWNCRCDCGKEIIRKRSSLAYGITRSCGCLSMDVLMDRNVTHGLSGTRVYNIWQGILKRTCNPKEANYKNYGARGITISDEWRDFETFHRDMGDPPSDTHSIERKDNNGNYCKDNCLWATRREQSRNTRRNRFITLDGVTKCIADWAEHLGVRASMISDRLESGWSDRDAVLGASRYRRTATIEGVTKPIAQWISERRLKPVSIYKKLRDGMAPEEALKGICA